jgi:SAM-dependent methyltransferase
MVPGKMREPRALPKLINSGFARLFRLPLVHRLFQSGIAESFRQYDRELAWPDVEFFIDNAPARIFGGVGGDSYTGWIYQQGFFAALIKTYVPGTSLKILDFGCGFGKLAPVSTFFTHPNGHYLGIDIRQDCVDTCRRTYGKLPRVSFERSGDYNGMYSEQRSRALENGARETPWPVAPGSIDLVVSVSVFTHLQERQAHYYVQQIHDVLKPGGTAILTFHVVGEERKPPRFTSPTKPQCVKLFDFSTPLPPSNNFFTNNPLTPDDGIAVNKAGLDALFKGRFEIVASLTGSTTGGEDPFFQDLFVLRKPLTAS